MKHTAPGGVWGAPPGKFLKFRPSEVASGRFWGPRRLVAEMLLHVEINLV